MEQENNIKRCGWSGNDLLYIRYHDEEWGREVTDDSTMFEFLVLESSQAGLSWITILRKRENYRKAFAGFDVQKVARFTTEDVDRLMQDPGIVRNRRKIEATINNAQRFIEVQQEFGSFCKYIHSFLPDGKLVINHWTTLAEIPAATPLSDAISKDMKKEALNFSVRLYVMLICRQQAMSMTTWWIAIAELQKEKKHKTKDKYPVFHSNKVHPESISLQDVVSIIDYLHETPDHSDRKRRMDSLSWD